MVIDHHHIGLVDPKHPGQVKRVGRPVNVAQPTAAQIFYQHRRCVVVAVHQHQSGIRRASQGLASGVKGRLHVTSC